MRKMRSSPGCARRRRRIARPMTNHLRQNGLIRPIAGGSPGAGLFDADPSPHRRRRRPNPRPHRRRTRRPRPPSPSPDEPGHGNGNGNGGGGGGGGGGEGVGTPPVPQVPPERRARPAPSRTSPVRWRASRPMRSTGSWTSCCRRPRCRHEPSAVLTPSQRGPLPRPRPDRTIRAHPVGRWRRSHRPVAWTQ